MNDRAVFTEKAEAILDFVDVYRVLKYSHLEKFFPDDKKIVEYLVKHRRLSVSPDGVYISTDEEARTDKTLMAALSVLSDIFEKVKTHTKAVPPAQISFLTHNGDYYEIIYVGYGMEAMVRASFETRLAAKMRNENHADITKRMVIVENADQMERLHIPGTTRFALVQPDGSLTYYRARS